jgi:hypothetical protein
MLGRPPWHVQGVSVLTMDMPTEAYSSYLIGRTSVGMRTTLQSLVTGN